MKKYPVYPSGLYVDYDHTALYIVIGTVVLLMIVGFVGYRIYTHYKKKKEDSIKVNISFAHSGKKDKNSTLK